MKKQKTRDQIEVKYTWDLSLIYKSEEDFYSDFELLKKEVNKVSKYKNNLFTSLEQFKSYLQLDEKIEILLNKLYQYANCLNDQDTTNSNNQKKLQDITYLYNKYREETSFFLPEVYKCDTKLLDSYLKDKDLLKYRRYFDEILRYKEHTLSTNEEMILSKFELPIDSISSSYEALTNSDISFPNIKDEDNKLVELTESNFSYYIRSRNRRVRKNAFNKLFNEYAKYKNTIPTIYLGNIDANITYAKLKGYNSFLESRLFPDKVDTKVYDNLIKTVKLRIDVIDNYFKTIKDTIGLSKLHRYDTYTKLVDSYNKEYSYDDAKELVIKTLNILGDDYLDGAKKILNNRIIDVYNNKGKRTGAYSSGNYDTKPYILLNYENTLNDVSTLIHELGHSMHTYFSCKNNDRLYSEYKIFVAEVASTTNELLLNNYLLENSNDDLEKLDILNNLISLYYATLVRQTMFAEFEKTVYEMREKGSPLTYEELNSIYYKLCCEYFGKYVVMDDLIKYEWMRIPHFYYGFYVYKYATSIAASTYIAEKLTTDAKFKDKYLKFLSSGGSMDPLDELKLVDVDLTNKEVINEAMNKFNYYIEEFKDTYQRVMRK